MYSELDRNRYLSRFVVPISWLPPGREKPAIASSIAIEICNQILLLTAGHVTTGWTEEFRFVICDSYQHHRCNWIPFAFEKDRLVAFGDTPGENDIAIYLLQKNTQDLLRCGPTNILSNVSWHNPSPQGNDFLVGVPDDSVGRQSFDIKVIPLTPVKTNQVPSTIQNKYPTFYAQLPSDSGSIIGMSGGPILRITDNKLWFIGIQSYLGEVSQIIGAEESAPICTLLEKYFNESGIRIS